MSREHHERHAQASVDAITEAAARMRERARDTVREIKAESLPPEALDLLAAFRDQIESLQRRVAHIEQHAVAQVEVIR